MNILPPCDKISVIPQNGPFCWMTSILSCILYSDGLQSVVKKHLHVWKSSKSRSQSLLYAILVKDLKRKSDEHIDFFNEFAVMKFVSILHEEDPNQFFHNPRTMYGCNPSNYISNIFKLIKLHHISLLAFKKKEMFDLYLESGEDHEKSPEVLIIKCSRDKNKISSSTKNVVDRINLNKHILYNGNEYTLDCRIIDNFNNSVMNKGHVISLLTCNKEQYMYNGWIMSDGHPCPLRKWDWLNEKAIFSLNTMRCSIRKKAKHNTIEEIMRNKSLRTKEYLFSGEFFEHLNNDYIYIYTKTKKKQQNKLQCKKITNPITGRLIDIDGVVAKQFYKNGVFLLKPVPKNKKIELKD